MIAATVLAIFTFCFIVGTTWLLWKLIVFTTWLSVAVVAASLVCLEWVGRVILWDFKK